MGLLPAYKGILPKTAFATMMSAYKASSGVGKIPARAGRTVQQHLDNEYIAYVPLIVAFSLIAAFVVAGRGVPHPRPADPMKGSSRPSSWKTRHSPHYLLGIGDVCGDKSANSRPGGENQVLRKSNGPSMLEHHRTFCTTFRTRSRRKTALSARNHDAAAGFENE